MRNLSRHHIRSVLDDYILPFVVGFSFVTIFYLISGLFGDRDYWVDTEPFPTSLPETFLDKNGQLFLKRHGVQAKEADIFRLKADRLEYSIQARASEQFKTVHVRHQRIDFPGGKAISEPPGTIWPWPRIEVEAPALPLVWVITPTYRNPYQYAELTRLAQALYPARRFVRWLVVDDTRHSKKHKRHMRKLNHFLLQFKVNFTLLKSKTRPPVQKALFNPKGVDARRTAVEYIRKGKLRGVVYFADDDNTYDCDIFRQMQATKTVSIWPTGAITQWAISSPVVDQKGQVVDFFDAWVANRKFPVDFASFAINADLLHENPRANIPWIQGYEETILLSTLGVPKDDFLPLAANATQVLTWHTKTVKFRENEGVNTRETWYPPTVKKLLDKYDFLFEKVEIPTAKPLKVGVSKSKRYKNISYYI